MSYFSTQLYDGFSCCFRNWRATSATHYLHGSSLSFKLVFGCEYLDDKHRVLDTVNEIKNQLKQHFEYKTLIAIDDPLLERFTDMESLGLMQLTILPSVNCESFALTGYNLAQSIIEQEYPDGRTWVESCEVLEHNNSAIYVRDKQ
jgi:6-pyruvoyltetrahydropterin/6-carboxytetrahydropterin synthase